MSALPVRGQCAVSVCVYVWELLVCPFCYILCICCVSTCVSGVLVRCLRCVRSSPACVQSAPPPLRCLLHALCVATSIATDPVADAGVPFAARATEVDALFAAAPSVDVVLAGTGKPGRLRQLAGLVTTAAAKSVGR